MKLKPNKLLHLLCLQAVLGWLFIIVPGPLAGQDLMLHSTAVNTINLDHETRLIKALDAVSDNRIEEALTGLENLVRINPRFRLAQLIYADLLLSRSRPITDFGNRPSAPYADIAAFRAEAIARWKHHRSMLDKGGLIPKSLVQLDPEQRFALIVDLGTPRLYVFERRDGTPRLVADFYVSIGKNGIGKYEEGDKKTPVGVYFATDYIDPSDLPDLYGVGAFPINYPNAWDRKNGHSGYGIWLHGTPIDIYSRPPRDSDGCIIISNEDLMALAPYIKTGKTPVILAESIDWVTPEDWRTQQARLSAFVEQWRRDWESRNTDRYLSHYSRDYTGLGMGYDEWVRYKHRVNASKQYIKVQLLDTSIFLYPDNTRIMVVTFDQDYNSDNVKRRFRKRQYWHQEEDGTWRIFYEGSLSS